MSNPRFIFTNIAVADLHRSRTFFEALGFAVNPAFSNDEVGCMVVNDHALVMLHTPGSFERFTTRPTADPASSTQVILAFSAESRTEVDELGEKALASGGSAARDPEDYGFMYQRSFHDPDGHLWEVAWMDPQAVAAGPPDMGEAAA
jgi:predicted lactoylglutathione lyase